jgi:hypothetical protein
VDVLCVHVTMKLVEITLREWKMKENDGRGKTN